MDSLKPEAQSFIIKVWVEDGNGEADQGVWRGHITHVPSYERRYLKNLDEIEDFIAPHHEGSVQRFRQRLYRALHLAHTGDV